MSRTDRPTPKPDALATVLACGLVAVLLLGWVPHYLTWPWWPDLDAWATIAQGWDAGKAPYRDVTIFNFPGPIEFSWLVGHAFGWGKPGLTYALDAGFLVGVGLMLVAWSRAVFHRALPGLIGMLALLHYYLNLDYAQVAQRDWHAPMLAVLGVLVLQTWPGRFGRVLGGACLGLGLTIRPHVILLVPVHALAIRFDGEGSEDRKRPGWKTAMPYLEWAAGAGLAVGAGFAPLLMQGLLGDFVAGVRKASYGGGYSRTSPGGVVMGVLAELGLVGMGGAFSSIAGAVTALQAARFDAILVGLSVVAWRDRSARGRGAVVWLSAMLLILLYAPLHPKPHAYLAHPRQVVAAAGLAYVGGIVLDGRDRGRRSRLAAALLMILVAVPFPPRYWRPDASLGAVPELVQSQEPARVPPGAGGFFAPEDPRSPFDWANYRRTLEYLRRTTGGTTPVANLLRNVPFPALNGPVGRVSPLPGESGVIWLWSVEPEREASYAEALSASPTGTVAVWDSGRETFDERLELERVGRVVRRDFVPEARFGAFEVWRKR